MGTWLSDNWWWILPALASVAFFVERVHSRTDRGESLHLALLYALMPFLEPDSRAQQRMWINVLGTLFFVAIVIVILVVGYKFF